jgi:CheY-like chemotaxis protein
MSSPERVVILIVDDERVLADLLQHFPVDRYELVLASGAAEAISICETKGPRLLVVPVEAVEDGLAEVLAEVRHEEALILGVARGDRDRDRWRREKKLFDDVIVLGEPSDLAAAVRTLLAERRQSPRVFLEFPVVLGDGAAGLVREFSGTSLRVETDQDLRGGSVVDVRIGWGPEPLQFKAIVGRIQRALFFAQHSVVLHVQDREVDAKAYLDKLVRGVVELQHILGGEAQGTGKLRGEKAWELTRRVEGTVRDSRGLVVRESGEVAVVSDLRDTQELFTDSIVTRYDQQEKVGQWGVGNVYRAVHKLLGRHVLLKVLRADLSDDADARLRLELEARCAVIWAGRNVVDVLDFGSTEDEVYYAMEELTGETLRAALARGAAYSALEVATLGIHLASGLTKIHLKGGGHYDLCPENVFLNRPGGSMVRPLLINVAGRECWGAPERTHAVGAAYRPPEAAERPPDPTFDVFALATTLREALDPGEAKSAGRRRLEGALAAATSAAWSQRFPNADAFCGALEDAAALLLLEAPEGQARLVEPPPGTGRISVHPTPVPPTPTPGATASGANAAPAPAAPSARETVPAGPSPQARAEAPGARAAAPVPALGRAEAGGVPVGSRETVPVASPPPDAARARVAPPAGPSPLPGSSADGAWEALAATPPPRYGGRAPATPPPVPPGVIASGLTPPPPPPSPPGVVASGLTPPPQPPPSPPGVIASGSTPPRPPPPAPSPTTNAGGHSPLPGAESSPQPSSGAAPAGSRQVPAPPPSPVAPDVDTAGPTGIAEADVPVRAARGRRPLVVIGALLAAAAAVALVLVLAAAALQWGRPGAGPLPEPGSRSAAAPDTGRGATADADHSRRAPPDAAEVRPARGPTSEAPPDAAEVRPARAPTGPGASPAGPAVSSPDAAAGGEAVAERDRLFVVLGKARRRIQSGRYVEAEGYLEEARLLGGGSDVHALRSMSFERQGRHADAIESLRHAIATAPSKARHHDRLGALYTRAGEPAKACESYRRAAALQPDSRTIARHVAASCR